MTHEVQSLWNCFDFANICTVAHAASCERRCFKLDVGRDAAPALKKPGWNQPPPSPPKKKKKIREKKKFSTVSSHGVWPTSLITYHEKNPVAVYARTVNMIYTIGSHTNPAISFMSLAGKGMIRIANEQSCVRVLVVKSESESESSAQSPSPSHHLRVRVRVRESE